VTVQSQLHTALTFLPMLFHYLAGEKKSKFAN